MASKIRTDERDSGTDLKFYLPAKVTPPVETSRFERLWGRLFNHGVEPPK